MSFPEKLSISCPFYATALHVSPDIASYLAHFYATDVRVEK